MLKEDIPGSFEQLVLLPVLRLGDNAYGMTVRRELKMPTAQPVSLGAVYTTMERLEKKGYLGSAPQARRGRSPGRGDAQHQPAPAGGLGSLPVCPRPDSSRRWPAWPADARWWCAPAWRSRDAANTPKVTTRARSSYIVEIATDTTTSWEAAR